MVSHPVPLPLVTYVASSHRPCIPKYIADSECHLIFPAIPCPRLGSRPLLISEHEPDKSRIVEKALAGENRVNNNDESGPWSTINHLLAPALRWWIWNDPPRFLLRIVLRAGKAERRDLWTVSICLWTRGSEAGTYRKRYNLRGHTHNFPQHSVCRMQESRGRLASAFIHP